MAFNLPAQCMCKVFTEMMPRDGAKKLWRDMAAMRILKRNAAKAAYHALDNGTNEEAVDLIDTCLANESSVE
jgi:hypothetical protein